MTRFWLKHYPAGVEADIDPDAFASLAQLLEVSMQQHAARPALVSLGTTLSYGDLDRLSRQFANWLLTLGLPSGSRVALMMPNCFSFAVAFVGTLRAGMTVVNVNPRYTPRELSLMLQDSGAEVLVVLENFAHTVAQVLNDPGVSVRQVVLTSMGDMQGWLKGRLTDFVLRRVKKAVKPFSLPDALRMKAVLAEGAARATSLPAVDAGQIAMLQYTGGTTGQSKGAILTHRNLVANVLQASAWFHPAMAARPGRAAETAPPVFVGALPLYHVFALMVCLLVPMRLGGLLVLIPDPRDVDHVVWALRRQRITVFPGLSTFYSLLMDDARFRSLDFTHLRLSVAGGMAVPSAVAARWLEVTGCAVCEGYGLTEASPTVACTPTDTTRHDGTVGLPLPSTEVKIVDENLEEVAQGESGEVLLRGPQIMAGYWRRPDETAAFLLPDGFFRTGDVGVMDERGYLRLLDRKKDLVVVSGFNVYSNEVEDVVCSHPGVKECAAVGVPDAHSGQVVKIFVVRSDPSVSAEALRAHCSLYLTAYKRPRQVDFVRWLPKSDIGKVLRRALRDGTVVPDADPGP